MLVYLFFVAHAHLRSVDEANDSIFRDDQADDSPPRHTAAQQKAGYAAAISRRKHTASGHAASGQPHPSSVKKHGLKNPNQPKSFSKSKDSKKQHSKKEETVTTVVPLAPEPKDPGAKEDIPVHIYRAEEPYEGSDPSLMAEIGALELNMNGTFFDEPSFAEEDASEPSFAEEDAQWHKPQKKRLASEIGRRSGSMPTPTGRGDKPQEKGEVIAESMATLEKELDTLKDVVTHSRDESIELEAKSAANVATWTKTQQVIADLAENTRALDTAEKNLVKRK